MSWGRLFFAGGAGRSRKARNTSGAWLPPNLGILPRPRTIWCYCQRLNELTFSWGNKWVVRAIWIQYIQAA